MMWVGDQGGQTRRDLFEIRGQISRPACSGFLSSLQSDIRASDKNTGRSFSTSWLGNRNLLEFVNQLRLSKDGIPKGCKQSRGNVVRP